MSEATIIAIRGSEDIVAVRQAVRARAGDLGFSLADTTMLVTAASELARSAAGDAGGGMMRIEPVSRGHKKGLRLVFDEQGPAIVDEELRRLVNEFQIVPRAGAGTRVSITQWK